MLFQLPIYCQNKGENVYFYSVISMYIYLCYLYLLPVSISIWCILCMNTQICRVQFGNFNPWKVVLAFSQNSFVISTGLLYHLITHDSWWLASKAFVLSNPIVSLKQQLNWIIYKHTNN